MSYLGSEWSLVMNEGARPKAFAASRPQEPEKAQGFGRIGVLLINLGTPDATTYWAMRRYLKEFLSDQRVIEVDRVLWWFILNFIVLMKRPFASGAKYRSIWNEELDESPLFTVTRRQAEKVAAALSSRPPFERGRGIERHQAPIDHQADAATVFGLVEVVGGDED